MAVATAEVGVEICPVPSELHPEPRFHAVVADARMDSRHMAVATAEVGVEICPVPSELHPEPQFHAIIADARPDPRHMAVATAEVGVEVGVRIVEVDVVVEQSVLP